MTPTATIKTLDGFDFAAVNVGLNFLRIVEVNFPHPLYLR